MVQIVRGSGVVKKQKKVPSFRGYDIQDCKIITHFHLAYEDGQKRKIILFVVLNMARYNIILPHLVQLTERPI